MAATIWCGNGFKSADMLASIIIRTYNEGAYLGELLKAIAGQKGRIVDH